MNTLHAEPLGLAPETSPFFFDVAPTCARCGAFGPLTTSGDREMCGACIARRHWIETEPTGVVSLVRGVAFLTVRLAPIAIPLQLAFALPIVFATMRFDLPFWVSAWASYVHVIAHASIWGMAAQRMAGEQIRPGKALGAAFSAWGRLASTMFAGSVQTFLFSLLLVVPGIYKLVGFVASLPTALHEPERGGADALAMSESRIDGLRVPVLTTYVGLAVLGVGGLFAAAIALVLAHAAAEIPITQWAFEVALVVVSSFAFLPLTLLPAVVYAKTRDRIPTYA